MMIESICHLLLPSHCFTIDRRILSSIHSTHPFNPSLNVVDEASTFSRVSRSEVRHRERGLLTKRPFYVSSCLLYVRLFSSDSSSHALTPHPQPSKATTYMSFFDPTDQASSRRVEIARVLDLFMWMAASCVLWVSRSSMSLYILFVAPLVDI